MATIQIKRRTTAGTGPLTGTVGTVKAGEPLVDLAGGHLYIARNDKTASTTTPLNELDYMAIPSTDRVDDQIVSKISDLSLGTAATKNTGTTSGCVPLLDANGKLVDSIIPKVALTNTFVVNSEATMLALSNAQEGDVAVRTDLNKTFILRYAGYNVLANWQELLTPTDSVQSVNGKTGVVSITLSDLSGVSNTTFNSHTSSDVHLTTNQKAQLTGLKNTILRADGDGGIAYCDDLVTLESSVITGGMMLHEQLTGNIPAETIYYIGIDKTKVLQPSSIIDGGTY